MASNSMVASVLYFLHGKPSITQCKIPFYSLVAVQTGSKALRPIWTDVRSVSKIVQLLVTLVPWLKIITFMGSQGGISPVLSK